MNDTQLRMDIQVLRALAVLAVVIYHTGLEVLPGGYLGVDIFFVISGFLIGKMIMTSCDKGTFSFADFYLRRLFRLVPATLCTLFVTTVLASVLLTHAGWEDFQSQLLGALTFTANFALYFQLDYFAPAAERMPLLHMWSLAIEEQFYLFAPVVIFLTPARLRTAVFVVFGGLSALACFTLMFGWIDLPVSTKRAQSTAFYMLPTRAWQLILGCLGAWVMLQRPRLTIPAFSKLGALAGTIYLLIAPVGISHPAEDAFLVCCFTLLLLLGQDNWVPRMAITAVFRKIGDWSYSIYLVHWPLFAFANNLFIAGPPLWSICLLCVASIGLGAAQYYYVETPFRYGWTAHKARALAGLCAAAIAMSLAALPSLTNALYPQDMRISEIPPNVGLSTVCNQKGAVFDDLAECRTVNAPRVALLGDSLAMQWGEALAEHSEAIGGLMQIT
ncbi:MAG: acyltransferase, partial [Pseudomonadota bacterium]